MLSRIRKAMQEDQGFTLIELLVVVIIIGILAAIAIPVFLNQKKKAVDASLKADLHSAATAEQSYITDNPTTPGIAVAAKTAADSPFDLGNGDKIVISPGNTVTVTVTTDGFCVTAENANSSKGAGNSMYYDSLAGGINGTDPWTTPSGACSGA